jgi:hypothetical protein
MPKTTNRTPRPRHCKIKAVDPAFRSVSTPRCPNDLGETGWVYADAAERARKHSAYTPTATVRTLSIGRRNDAACAASACLLHAARRHEATAEQPPCVARAEAA